MNETILSCPNCPDQGWWVDYNTYAGEPEQVQCEFCYCEPNSKFLHEQGDKNDNQPS